jgi:hypothetical protein
MLKEGFMSSRNGDETTQSPSGGGLGNPATCQAFAIESLDFGELELFCAGICMIKNGVLAMNGAPPCDRNLQLSDYERDSPNNGK